MCGKVAQWLRFWAVNRDSMGSNPAETVYIFILLTFFTTFFLGTSFQFLYLLTPKNVDFFSKCVAIVATIFALDRNGILDFRFDILIFLLNLDAMQNTNVYAGEQSSVIN